MSDAEIVGIVAGRLSTEPPYATEHPEYRVDLARSLVQLVRQHDLLDKVTTRALLVEVAERMRITQNSTSGRALGVQCETAVEKLDPGVLDWSRP